MKNLLINLLPASIISSLISLALCYIFLYRWSQDGFSESEIIISLFFTIPVFLIVCTVIDVLFLRKFLKDTILSEETRFTHWFVLFIFVTLTTIIISLLLDFLYFNVDNLLFEKYTKGLVDALSEEENDSTLEDLKNSTFFVQTIFQNIFGIIVATLISTLITKKYRNQPKTVIL
jgi:heme/copper-type cytochrome/quinol oxidase subunit 2